MKKESQEINFLKKEEIIQEIPPAEVNQGVMAENIANEVAEEKFGSEKAIKYEEGLFEKYKLKKIAGKMVAMFTMASCLSLAAPKFSEAFGVNEKNKATTKEQEDSAKQEKNAHEFIHTLSNLPDDPGKNEEENYKRKAGLAEVLVHYESVRRTDGTSERVQEYKRLLAKIALEDKKINGGQRHFIMGVLFN